MATGRQRHQSAQAEAPETPATVPERMAAKIRTPGGKALDASRKGIVAPVCGQSKAARGFRRFLLRGVAMIRGAWRLVCLTHNLRKLWRDGRGLSAISAVLEMRLWACEGPCQNAVVLRSRHGLQRQGHVKGRAPSGHAHRHAQPGRKEPITLILGQAPRGEGRRSCLFVPASRDSGTGRTRHLV